MVNKETMTDSEETTLKRYTLHFVSLSDHRKQMTVTVEDENLSWAYAKALARATSELGCPVVLRQDHPRYKS